jgi:uncharacterized RDD family membrane protein YckC
MRIAIIGTAGAFLSIIQPTTLLGEEWRPARLWVTGGDEAVWVVGQSAGRPGDLPVIQMWHADRQAGPWHPKQTRLLPAVAGDILQLGADAEAMRILFSDLSSRDYDDERGSLPGARWRDESDEPPLAWGGDTGEAILWAVARTETLKPSGAHAGSTQEADSRPAAGRQDRLAVLELQRGVWRRTPGPPAAEEGETFWVTGRKGTAWLFWQMPEGGVLAACRAVGATSDLNAVTQPQSKVGMGEEGAAGQVGWETPEPVTPGHARCGWAGASRRGPVFLAGLDAGGEAVQVHLYSREDGDWTEKGPARDGTELLEIDPRRCGAGVAGGRVCVVRPTEKGGLEFGFGDIGVSPSIRFTPLAVRRETPADVSTWQDTLVLALLLALLTVLLWKRRGQAARPVVLPPGFVVAPAWRRLSATIIDCLPALMISTPLVWRAMPETLQSFDLSVMEQVRADPELQDKLLPAYAAFLLLYGLWCLFWELGIASTPGKLLLRCRVAGTQGGALRTRQIFWRNALRVVEVGMGAPGWIITLLMLVLVTQNRQRVGDILADTVVIMRGTAEGAKRAAGDDRWPNEPGE